MLPNITKINIRGKIFETDTSKFKAIPKSRLATLSTTDSCFRAERNEFFFDRNPAIFDFILDLYDCEELHLPKHVCSSVIKREMDFWRIGKETVSKCCLKTLYKDDDDMRMYSEYQKIFDEYSFNEKEEQTHRGSTSIRGKGRRQRIWRMLYYPFDTKLSKIYFSVIFISVILSIIIFTMATLKQWREPRSTEIDIPANMTNPKIHMYMKTRQKRVLSSIDVVSNTILFIDYILLIYSSPVPAKQIRDWYFVLDLFTLMSVYAYHVLDQTDHLTQIAHEYMKIVAAWVGVMYCFRIVRVLRLLAYTKGWVALYMTFVSIRSVILFFLAGFFFTCMMSAALIYHAELWSSDSFQDMFMSIWWSVVTLSSVGYGDMVPSTTAGKVMTIICVIFGLLLVAIPMVIITNNYGNYYQCYEHFNKHEGCDARRKFKKENQNHEG